MKIFTLNQLCCPKCSFFPLSITEISEDGVSSNPMPINLSLLKHLYNIINFSALKEAASSIGIEGLPDTFPDSFPDIQSQEEAEKNPFIKSLSTLLFGIDLVNCTLKCKDCQREYSVKDRIPNMILNEQEMEEKAKLMKARGTKKFILHEMTNQTIQNSEEINQQNNQQNSISYNFNDEENDSEENDAEESDDMEEN